MTPRGVLVRRFICRRAGLTVSLLPDCSAAHLTGPSEAVEAAVRVAPEARHDRLWALRVKAPLTSAALTYKQLGQV